ncbi:hypothetical protein [Streptomyces sp. SR-10]|uniref:hypothetical protein n=1 Tax=Streptomyces sp. SR-10 TaxID=3416442 RepID=UPI003CF407B1
MSHRPSRTPEHRLSAAKRELGLPVIVALCGSTRFMTQMNEAELRETFAGRIVVKPACDLKTPHPLWADPARAERLKADLGELHRAKIRLADEVLVVNVRLSSPSPRFPRAVPPVLRSASMALCHPQG